MRIPDTWIHIKESPCIDDSVAFIEEAVNGLINLSYLLPNGNEGQGRVGYSHGQGYSFSQSLKNPLRFMDPFLPLVNGLYVPASKRLYWQGRFDVEVDDLPDDACCTVQAEDGVFTYATAQKIKRLPKSFALQGKVDAVAHYRITECRVSYSGRSEVFNKSLPKRQKGASDSLLLLESSFLSVLKDGNIAVGADLKKHPWWRHNDMAYGFVYGSRCLGLEADRKYLFNVEATDESLGKNSRIIFGADSGHVKSLLFARDAPLTRTGRRSPVLHWVSAHKRRLSEGIDIDIKKHLRGSDTFSMGGIRFSITSPVKERKGRKTSTSYPEIA